MPQQETDYGATHMPTEEEIEAYCALLRLDWSERQHRLRAGLSPIGRSSRLPEASRPRRRFSTIDRD